MVKTQVRIPDTLFREAKRLAAENEMSFAEVVRQGLEAIVRHRPPGRTGPYIEFDGQDCQIAPTSRKVVTVLFHPFRKLWVLDHPPKLTWPPILGHFTLKSV